MYEIRCCVLCKMSVGTVDIPAFSLCFWKLFVNLKPTDTDAANAPEEIGPADFSYLAQCMVRKRLRSVTTHLSVTDSRVARKACGELTLVQFIQGLGHASPPIKLTFESKHVLLA